MKLAPALVVILLTVFTAESTIAAGDPCMTYTEIYEPHRSTAHVVTGGFSCDVGLQPGWYRFTAYTGGKMAEECQDTGHCGTRTPIWLNGIHPDIADGITDMTACISYGLNLCCVTEISIQVKKCPEGFYVYNLAAPYGCDSGYCVGSIAPCGPDEAYNYFHKRCGDITPTLTDRPVLYNPIIDEHYRVVYKCEIMYGTPGDNAEFEVAFLFDGELYDDVPNDTVVNTGNSLYANLNAWHLGEFRDPTNNRLIWESKMGKEITCAVRANWEGREEKTDWISSEPKWAGIQIATHHLINLPQEEESFYELTFYSTVPFTCWGDRDADGSCSIEIPFWLGGNGVATSTCKFEIQANKWSDDTQRADGQIIKMRAVKDQDQRNPTQTMTINLGAPTYRNPFFHEHAGWFVPHMFSGYTPEATIQVRVEDAREGRCTSTGDPHIRTFDNGPQAHNIAHGDFVLYASTAREFEVQSRHWTCGSAGTVTCNCGVAVREANDIVIIDMCQSRYGYAHPTVSYKTATGGPLSHAVTVERDPTGKKHKVSMPSGAYIVSDARLTHMQITVHAPGADFRNTEGLCGYWDGDPSNDLRMRDGSLSPSHTWRDWHHEYSEDWRVRGPNFFHDDCFTPTDDPIPNVEYCQCISGNSLECDFKKLVKRNNVGNIQTEMTHGGADDTLLRASGNIQCARRRKRDVADIRLDPELYTDDLNELGDYDYDPQLNFQPIVNDWPTPNFGITEDQARDICREAVTNLTVATACRDVVGIDIFSKVDTCMADIQVTEDISYALSAAEEIEEECSARAYQNTSLYEVNEDGVAVPPTIITSQLCPRQCSQRGECVNGTCQCKEGYISADCSMKAGRAPQVLSLPAKGLCDIRHRPCMKAVLLADGLIDSENLTCRVTQVPIHNGVREVQHDTTGQTEGRMLSSGEVRCHLPRSPVALGTPAEREGAVTHGMMLSVSNDGQRFSQELLFTVYDSVCQECTDGGNCFWKPNTCIIRGHCFASGEADPNNWCQQCLPQFSNTTWTERPVNQAPRFNSPSTITKVAGENLTLTIGAVDPEGRPLTLSRDPGSPSPDGVLLLSNGELSWHGHDSSPFSMLITITDECGASFQQTFQFQIMDCPCQHNGVCIPDVTKPRGQGFYTCECPGYTGQYCETEIDECAASPCKNGTCIDRVNGYNCTCDAGSTGPNCGINIDDLCAQGACHSGVSCINLGGGEVRCGRCPAGYFGNGYICEDIDECADAQAYGCHHICQNVPGSYRCTCQPGFLLVGQDCIDLDECLVGISECSHICVNTNGSYTCLCPQDLVLGPDGKACRDVDECLSTPCMHGGQCHNGDNQFTCTCPRGWIGEICEEDINECVLTNHGCEYQCTNTPGGYECVCPEGHVVAADGKSCEVPSEVLTTVTAQEITDCRKTGCPDKQTQECVEANGVHVCQCVAGYYLAEGGTLCKESTAFTGEITLTTFNGNKAVFTADGLGTPGSREFIEMATLLEEALNTILQSSSLQDKFLGCKVKTFRQGSVIAEFEIYVVEDAGLSPSDVMDAILNGLSNNTISGTNGVIVVIPSSLQVSSQATDAPDQMWYNNPMYLTLLCVGCAVLVTTLIVGAVCLLTSPKRRRKMVVRDSMADMGMTDMTGKDQGIDGPATEDDKYE
ncbi:PREDICTED: von Willebrand factor D and EGF domain-containing protein-like isoform X2 [Branchiostoma belcheri]|uniref:von Willebrand factor D and EGF domain-containing protein-like isoform X2 n=1 Tax=Branchiostoma belcheri TaxID=7741 RepID=A0A6P4XT01_BRABE|nr:PREDICTED: von Willebrand factor D and EGF domain-containing protein-like isoform X2 [Branchiostoma belcheri]